MLYMEQRYGTNKTNMNRISVVLLESFKEMPVEKESLIRAKANCNK